MKYIMLIFLYFTSLFAGTGFLPEDGAGLKGRILGYGFGADVNDISGIFYNPAGIVNLSETMFEFNYQSIYNNWFGLKNFSFDGIFSYETGIKFSIKDNNIGIFVKSLENQFEVYDESGNFEEQSVCLHRNLYLTYGRSFLKDFGFGINFNLTQLRIQEYNEYSFGTGLGIKLFQNLPYSFGLYLKNIYSTGMKLKNELEKEKSGVISGIDFMIFKDLKIYLGGYYEKDSLLKFSLGSSYKIYIFQIMAGYETGDFNTGDNIGRIDLAPLKNGKLKSGISIYFKNIRIGYGIILTNLGENHIFSFVFNN